MAPKKKKPVRNEVANEFPSEANGADDSDKSGEGWQDITGDRAPWIVKKPKLVVSGYLLGRFTFGQGKNKRAYYQFKLTCNGVEAVTGSGEDQKSVTLGRGDVVSLGESYALQRDLGPLTTNGGKYEIRLWFGEPEYDHKGKPKFWPIKTQAKMLKAPTRKAHEVEDVEPDSDDIPF